MMQLYYVLGVLCVASVPAGHGHIDAAGGVLGVGFLVAAFFRYLEEGF